MPPSSTAERSVTAPNPIWPIYRLFGFTLASDFPFANRLSPGVNAPDVTFTCADQSFHPTNWEQAAPAYASPYHTDDGKSVLYVHERDGCKVLRFTRVADCIAADNLQRHGAVEHLGRMPRPGRAGRSHQAAREGTAIEPPLRRGESGQPPRPPPERRRRP